MYDRKYEMFKIEQPDGCPFTNSRKMDDFNCGIAFGTFDSI